jgi:predicted branched-subunit amino acid permease
MVTLIKIDSKLNHVLTAHFVHGTGALSYIYWQAGSGVGTFAV